MGRLFGTDGIRGKYGEYLNGALAKEVGRALVQVLPKNNSANPRIVVGMDTRISSLNLLDDIMVGICEAGGDATNIKVCPTPAVAYFVTKHGYDAGVMISASHNPWEYNGIKIFGADGFKLNDELENKIEELVLDNDELFHRVDPMGLFQYDLSAIDEYIDYVVESCNCKLDGLRIGIDCANGSASATAEKIFTRLGAECYIIANKPNGTNINDNCGSTHLDTLRKLVIESELDLGIAFDGDADRCLAIDENGQEIDGDFILAILGKKMKDEGALRENKLVGTVMSNLGLVKFCEENNIEFLATKVGDRYVLEALNEKGLSLGGEQSGHIILRELSTTGDGQLTAAYLLSHLKKSGKSLSTLASIMKKYPQYMINVRADADDKARFKTDEIIAQIISESETEMGSHGRILIRPSGTEPLIRVMTEGDDHEIAESICKSLAEKIKNRLNELNQSVGQ